MVTARAVASRRCARARTLDEHKAQLAKLVTTVNALAPMSLR